MARLYNLNRSAICVLASGGLDSDVLVAELAQTRRHLYPIYIRQGLSWESVELFWLRQFLKKLKNPKVAPLRVLELPMDDVYGDHWSIGRQAVPGYRSEDRAVYLPGRNLVLLVKAAVFCTLQKIPEIAVGSLEGNPFPDASVRFFKQWSRLLGLGLRTSLTIRTPFRTLTKADVIQRGKSLPLELSFSCLAPVGKRHCGRCNKCAERKKAFRQARQPDQTIYAKN